MTKQSKTPTLDRLMAEGIVKLDSTGTYVGTASDGTVVQFGVGGGKFTIAIESYLTANPSPEQW